MAMRFPTFDPWKWMEEHQQMSDGDGDLTEQRMAAAAALRAAEDREELERAFLACRRAGVVTVRMAEDHPLELPLTAAYWYRAGVCQAMRELFPAPLPSLPGS